ncbi:hypothetical protein OIU35_15300 [Boseaceae bacterium BT-24-1]|nr:hypothetical protein [Boseaceae bacterium BT-24-1]
MDLSTPNEMTRVSATLKGAETSSFGVPGSKPDAFAIPPGSEVSPAKPRTLMSHALRNRTRLFIKGERFLSVGRVVIVRGSQLESTNMGFRIRHYRLAMKCEDCDIPFQQSATRAAIRRDELSRRCERCKSPGKPTRAGAFLARERRRQKAAEAEKLRLDALHLRRIQKLSAAMGRPVPPEISLRDLFQAEQRHIRKTRLAHQRAAWILGLPLSEIATIAIEQRARRRAEAAFA